MLRANEWMGQMAEPYCDDSLYRKIVGVVVGHFNTNGGGGLLHARAIFRAAKVLEWVATWLVARHFGEQARECDELDRMCAKDQDDWADNEASEIVKIVLAYDTSGVKPPPDTN